MSPTTSASRFTRPLALSLLVCVAWASQCAGGSEVRHLLAERARLEEQYALQLLEFAEQAASKGLDDEARAARNWLPPRRANRLVLFVVEDSPAQSTSEEGYVPLRRGQAMRLWELARQAASQHEWELALQWATDAVREDPNHRRAREALGYQCENGHWSTELASRKRAEGRFWDERFGWVTAEEQTRYSAGGGTSAVTLSNGQKAARGHNSRDVWHVETDHFLVTTYHSLEEGVRLGMRLEQLHQIWLQVFARCGLSAEELAYRFRRDDEPSAVPRVAGRRRPHRIVQYGSRAEYVSALRGQQPRIEMTLGIYFDRSKRGYFFAGEGQAPETVLHEATHQLFQESRRVSRQLGRRNNFWIVEGIATYMESLTECDGYWMLGDPETGRFPAARQRLLRDRFYVPLAELTGMGLSDVQRHPALPALYSQMAGVSAFLMHYKEGRYRTALVEYLLDVYSDQAQADSLASRTGASYDELDRQYMEYQAAVDAALGSGKAGVEQKADLRTPGQDG
jgi:hypothetical protein